MFLATKIGIPISTTHRLVGALFDRGVVAVSTSLILQTVNANQYSLLEAITSEKTFTTVTSQEKPEVYKGDLYHLDFEFGIKFIF